MSNSPIIEIAIEAQEEIQRLLVQYGNYLKEGYSGPDAIIMLTHDIDGVIALLRELDELHTSEEPDVFLRRVAIQDTIKRLKKHGDISTLHDLREVLMKFCQDEMYKR